MNIGWTIYTDPRNADTSQWKDLVYETPEPLWPLVRDQRKDSDYLMCPAVSDYFSNMFVIKCPYDVTISYNRKTDMYQTDRLGQEWYNQTFFPRFPIMKNDRVVGSCVTMRINYLFVADQDVEIESSDVPILHTDLTRNIRMIPGTMNIHKWIRPVDFTFEIIDLDQPLQLKRGDPLFAVKFKTSEKVNLTHVEYSKDLKHITEACLASKTYVPRKSLKYRYKMAERWLTGRRWL
jgi:hypothetical protein